MSKRNLTDIEIENFKSLSGAIGKMIDLLQSATPEPSDFRKVINVLYSCSKAIGGTIEEAVNVVIEALLSFLQEPCDDRMGKIHEALAALKHDLQEL